MIVVLSPSKGQEFETPAKTKKRSTPRDLSHSALLITEARKISRPGLKRLMDISTDLAKINHSRFKNFTTPFSLDNAKQCIFAFTGDAYNQIPLEQYTAAELTYMQKHLRIISGLYGSLRPLDLIQAYRLEMKTKLANPRGSNLYQFWGKHITNSINKDLAKQKEKVLVNLASSEYFKSVKHRLIDGRVLNIDFKETRARETRVIAIFAKRACGAMTNYIMRNQIEHAEDIKSFDFGGYKFDKKNSMDNYWIFERKQIS